MMEPTTPNLHSTTTFKEKMEDFQKECSSEVKTLVSGQFPVLRKLFGDISEPKSQILSFLEMFKVIFKTGRTDSSSSLSLSNQNHHPDASTAGRSPLSEEEEVIKGCVEKYRFEMHNCINYKSRSLHSYVSEEELRVGHETGVTTVLNWLREQHQGGRHNISISEDLIKSTMEEEYSWIKGVNRERFQTHVRHSYHQELRNGRVCLENNFIFKIVVTTGGGGNEQVAKYEMQELNRKIDAEIERRVQSFPENFPLGQGDEGTIANSVNNMAATLRSKLEELGSQVKNKNGERLAPFVDSYLTQVVSEYGEIMSLLLVNKSLLDVTEIKEKHKQLKTEGLGKWEAKILSLDRAYSTSDQLVQVDTMIEQKFRLLWSRRREAILEENLVGYRKDVMKVIMERMRGMGADANESFCARVSTFLTPIDKLMKDKVEEAVQIGLSEMREDAGVVDAPQTYNSEFSPTTSTASGNDRQMDDVPPVRDETPVAQPSSSMLSSSSSVKPPLASYKWELEPIPNHEHLLPPKTPSGSTRAMKRSSCRESINQSLRTFGISLTNGGLRAAITIDHVPHVLTEMSATAAAGHSEKSTIIPLLMGLGSDSPEFVFGNAVNRLKQQQLLLWQIDVAELFHSEHSHLSEPPLTRQLGGGEQVTFQLELVLAKIFHHVKTLMEEALKERFVGENENMITISLEKLLISVPPHFQRLQLRQILDATLVIGLETKFVATLCEPTLLAFDFFRKKLESLRQSSGNILVISQYSSEYIVTSLFTYSKLKSDLTFSPRKQYPFRDSASSTPSQNFEEEETLERISEYLMKTIGQDCSIFVGRPLFICLSTEDESYSSIIRMALKAVNMDKGVVPFPLDKWASTRGLTSVGDYGYWKGGLEKQMVHLAQDRFIKYRGDPTPDGSLSDAQVNECVRMFFKFFGNSNNSDDVSDVEPQPQPKRKRGNAKKSVSDC